MADLLHERALASDMMSAADVQRIRERMELAEARKLQPHFIRSFFTEAFEQLGGRMVQRESGRYEIKRVPQPVRERDRIIGTRVPLLPAYERVTFDKDAIAIEGRPVAELLCPGHPLLEAVTDLTLEQMRPLLKQGAVLVAEADGNDQPRLLVCLEHNVHDARTTAEGQARVVSRRMQFAEVGIDGAVEDAGYAPHLDYRPVEPEELALIRPLLKAEWLTRGVEETALEWAIQFLAPEHLAEVRDRTVERVDRTMAAVRERLTREIAYWDNRAEELKARELAGKAARGGLNSGKARQRCEALQSRLRLRIEELEQERQVASAPPVIHGGALIVPHGMLLRLGATTPPGEPDPATFGFTRDEVERLAVDAVLAAERLLGREPQEQSHNNPGFDVLSHEPDSGRLHFVEVKGRIEGATTVTVTKNEIIHGLNKGEDYVLALVTVRADRTTDVRYVRCPFAGDAGIIFEATSVNYTLADLLGRSADPN